LRTSEEENRGMIGDTVSFLKGLGKEVVYDAEHFFDGYKDSADHALATLRAAADGGADILVLCDTNGGTLPHEVFAITEAVAAAFDVPIGIHTHNDGGCGTANSMEAVRAGAVQVQGTLNGYGERCGNANLCDIIPNLMLKLGHDCLTGGDLAQLKDVSDLAHELANHRPDSKAPFVGASAFAHKGGMHVDGVRKNPASFEHIDPAAIGSGRRILISELSGTSNVFFKAVEMGLQVNKDSPELKDIRRELERQEREGYAFEAAEASFQLLMRKVLNEYDPAFALDGFRVIVEKRNAEEPCVSEATIKLKVGSETAHTVGEADGPVDALNEALRRALTTFHPSIQDVVLTDYRVRILDPEEHTAAKTRVLIESTDGERTWTTVGVSENIIEASWEALVDSVEYKLYLGEKASEDAP
jgi:2-isopropylmalate synthase